MTSQERASKKQRELLSFVDTFIKGNGYGPSYREIMRALGYKSVSTVAVHIDGLINRGYLIKRTHSARSLEVVGDDVAAPKPAADTEHQQWLVKIIDKKFDKYELTKQAATLDEVRILTESLKVLGFKEAYIKAIEKLADLS